MCLGSKRYVVTGSVVREERLVLRGIIFDGENIHIFGAKSKAKIHRLGDGVLSLVLSKNIKRFLLLSLVASTLKLSVVQYIV